MASKETIRDRQNSELEVIKSIYGIDVEDLRPKGDVWKPLDLRIRLMPLKGSSGDQKVYVWTKLHVTCPAKYPKVVPKIALEETKGIADSLIEDLLHDIQKQAAALKGEVMIYDLAQSVQAFLHKHNKPPSGSFYDEMLQQKQKREEEMLNLQKMKETEEQQNLREMIEKRKEVFKNERKRREPRRSISESNAEKHRQASSSESSENSSPYCRSHVYPNKCSDHRNSDMLYFPKVGRQIRRGCCLGHSQKGYIAYSGIDVDTGQLLYITEWNIKYSHIEQKYNPHEPKTASTKVDDFIADIEKQISNLAQIRHRNLIHYECVMCLKKKEGLYAYLVQDFVLGTSISSITASLGWCAEGASMVAKGVLDALINLHNKGVSHNHLYDSTVFMDNTGTIRCTDFSVVQNLLDLNGGQKTDKDLPALGVLLESLMPTQHSEMRDFIDKCKSDRTLSASDLLEHPFLRPSLFSESKTKSALIASTAHVDRPLMGAYFPQPTFSTVSHSRLHTEFEVLQWLGKGAYGDVLKVRNILDNREYAIKRIPLPARSRQLYRKMTREVEVLSRLNHENVVRYFTSWIETANAADLEDDKLGAGDWSYSQESYPKPNNQIVNAMEATDGSSSSSICFMPNIDDSDSDGIEFVDSNGDVAVYENDDSRYSDDDDSVDVVDAHKKSSTPKPIIQIMYIQMEFCEKFTLRAAIDNNVFEDQERVWRLFREIAEGLAHIHQQGMIHRDLKPVNIFLDSRDQIKIGDFGLATTSFLALQCHDQSTVNGNTTAIESGTGTGKVGTTLYVAPELTGTASKSIYNQKVDMYTLGIILFEMCNPPFDTGMERVKTILALRNPSIIIPESMLMDQKHTDTIEILRWLLNHDPSQRPTAEELLASDLVPVAQFEVTDLHEMLRHILANPQSKAYKHLVARCLQQECDKVLELTYHLGLVTKSSVLELIKNKVINLFRKHGAIEISTPLLTPFSKNTYVNHNPVKLMTHSGSVVILPNDLHAPFARYIAMSGANMVRRYSVNRVYREKKVFNFHPKQNYECAFDIITPNPGNHLVDAELLSVAYEMITEIPLLKQKNISIRMNHTSLLRAILLNCNVPDKKYDDLFESMLDYIEGRKSKFHLHSSISSIMETSKTSVTVLMDLLLADFPLGGPRGNIESSALKTLIRGKGEAGSLAKGAIRELETVVGLAQSLGVICPIHVYAGLPIGYNRASSGGIVWQMLGDLKPNRTAAPSVLAVGERYDTMLAEYQKQAQMCNVSIPHRPISGAGMSFSLDKLVAAVEKSFEEESRSIDVVVCVSGSRPPLKDVTNILRLLWSAGIRSGVVEAIGPDEAQDFAKDLGAAHFILLAEGGVLRVRSWDQGRFHERSVNRTELVEYVQRMLRNDNQQQTDSVAVPLTSTSSGTSLNYAKTSYMNQLPNVQVMFMTHEKMTANMRRRMENQVTQQMTATLQQFGKKENFNVIVADLPPPAVNAIIGAINPRGLKEELDREMAYVYERFSKHKRYIISIYDEILDILSEKNSKPIVALYSAYESYFRVII